MQLAMGRKYDATQTFEKIAAEMGTGRPKTHLWKKGLPDARKYVLKREFSDTSSHVILPGKRWPKEMGDYRWILQEHAPLLGSAGEWRVFFGGGKIVHKILTKKNGHQHWMVESIRSMRSLEKLRYVMSLERKAG